MTDEQKIIKELEAKIKEQEKLIAEIKKKVKGLEDDIKADYWPLA